MGETYCTRDVVDVLKAGVEDVDAIYVGREEGPGLWGAKSGFSEKTKTKLWQIGS